MGCHVLYCTRGGEVTRNREIVSIDPIQISIETKVMFFPTFSDLPEYVKYMQISTTYSISILVANSYRHYQQGETYSPV